MSDDQQQRIILGAQELFFKYGIRGVTMDDIASHLGVSKKTIYRFFKDKSELLDSLTDLLIQKNKTDMDAISDKSVNAVDEIVHTMNYMETFFQKMNPAVFYDMRKYYPSAWKKFLDFKEGCVSKLIEENLLKGIKQNLYRNGLPIKVLARLRMEQIEMVINPVIFPPDKFNFTQVHINLLEHFLYGICTIKGHKMVNKYKQITDDE